jgi:hypothetical protein
MVENVDRLNKFIQEGRLLRGEWTGKDAEGRETACLLAALSKEVATSHDPNSCPAAIMPSWLAHLVPWIDDKGTKENWLGHIHRFANLAGRWHALSPESWERARFRVNRVSLLEAIKHTKSEPAFKASRDVLALLDRAVSSDLPTNGEWSAAVDAARWSAADAPAARWAAAVADDDYAAARLAADAAADAAAARWSSTAAARWSAARWSAADDPAARWAAQDRIIDGILDVIEDEIKIVEAK